MLIATCGILCGCSSSHIWNFYINNYMDVQISQSQGNFIMAFDELSTSLALLLPLVVFLSLITSRKLRKNSAYKLPPGPAKLPVIGNLHQLGDNLHQSLWRLSQKHGPLMYLKLGQVPTVVVSSSELAKQVLKTHDLESCSRPHLIGPSKLSYGCSDINFAPYGEMWKELRKISMTELFNNKKVHSPNFVSVREEEVDQAMRLLASYATNSLPVNISEVVASIINNTICRVAFGKICANDLAQFYDILREVQALAVALFVADYIPILGWVDELTGANRRLERTFVKLDNFYQQLIDDHIQAAANEQRDFSEEDTLGALLRMRKDNKYLTENCIRGLVLDILVAGTDTSSAIIEWAMTELMRKPELMKKAQEEVRSSVGRKRIIEERDLDKFNYLKLVIKETMRIHPATPLLVPRETMQHFKLNGYDIPPKTRIIVNSWVIGRDPDLWEKPQEFNPERFIDMKDYDFKFIPFGEGRRICPGKNLGTVMVELVLANLLHCFDWHLPCGMTKEDIDMDEAPGITVHRKSDLWLVPRVYDGIEV